MSEKLNVPRGLRESAHDANEIVSIVRATAKLESQVDHLQTDVTSLRSDLEKNYKKSDEIARDMHALDKKIGQLIRLDHIESALEKQGKQIEAQGKELNEVVKKQEYERGKGFWITAGASTLLSALVALFFWMLRAKGG